MSGAADSPSRVEHARRPAPPTLSDAVSLAPLPASEAVGRATGMGRASLTPARPPIWRAAGTAGLVALVAAATMPLVAAALAIPL